MITIVNVDKNVRQRGAHEYEIKINQKVITRFTHKREESLKELFLMAAIAVEASEKDGPKEKVKLYTPPRYDDVYHEAMQMLINEWK